MFGNAPASLAYVCVERLLTLVAAESGATAADESGAPSEDVASLLASLQRPYPDTISASNIKCTGSRAGPRRARVVLRLD